MKRGSFRKIWRGSARLIGAAFLFTTIASTMPMEARANNGETYDITNSDGDIIIRVDGNGNQTVRVGSAAAVDDPNPRITGSLTTHMIIIDAAANQTANVTLAGVSVDVHDTVAAAALRVIGAGAVNIELDGSNSLYSGQDCAGLQDGLTGLLTIKDTDHNGSLNVTGGRNGAGIGGGNNRAGSDITISGGTVRATGGDYGAGIGGGRNGAGSDITISGGTVRATGRDGGANIGGGAGIGGGLNGAGSDITISGGTVTATGGTYGAGIGGGSGGAGSDITISGGTVTATGGNYGAGIGGGNCSNGDHIEINNGTIIAVGGMFGAGIGSGCTNNGSDSITISGSAQVSVAGGSSNSTYGAGAAIGGGGQVGSIDGTALQPNGSLNGNGYIHTYDPGTSVDDIRNDINNQGGGGNGGNNNNAGNHHSGGGSSGGSSHSESHIHSYSWVVTEKPTAYENGKMVYQCSCGHILDRADIEASAELITDGITSFSTAEQGATVRLDFGYYFSISKAFATAHDARPDVTTIITYYYKGEHFELTIPAGVTLLQTIDEKGWAGFKFIETFPGITSQKLP